MSKQIIRLRSFGGPWGKNNDVDEVIVQRDYLWIGTREGGMSIHGRKTLLSIADSIYEQMGDRGNQEEYDRG